MAKAIHWKHIRIRPIHSVFKFRYVTGCALSDIRGRSALWCINGNFFWLETKFIAELHVRAKFQKLFYEGSINNPTISRCIEVRHVKSGCENLEQGLDALACKIKIGRVTFKHVAL